MSRRTTLLRVRLGSIAALAVAAAAHAEPASVAGGGAGPDLRHDALDPAARAAIEARLAVARDVLAPLASRGAAPPEPVLFDWPLRGREGFPDAGYHGVSNFVDLDGRSPGFLLDWNCGARSYDLADGYDHGGIDFFLWPFAWSKMAAGDVEIVAAAPGVLLAKDDGHFDGNCAFNGDPWNAVYVLHADDTVAWYGHMRSGSTTAKTAGDPIERGERLGLIGSSGSSTTPHLHFELHDAADQVLDPFTGPCHQLPSLWVEQPPYYDSALNRIATHDAPPQIESCNQEEARHERAIFDPGETVYFVAYFRDQLDTQTSSHTVRRPDGSVFQSWSQGSDAAHYASSYWYRSWTLPPSAPHGIWRYEVQFLAQDELATFRVPEASSLAQGGAVIAGLATRCRRRPRQRGSKNGFQGAERAASTSASAGERSRPASSAPRVAARLLR